MRLAVLPAFVSALTIAACSGGGGSSAPAPADAPALSGLGPPTPTPSGAPAPTAPPANPAIAVPPGFAVSVVANVAGARELAFAPDGALIVGTTGSSVEIVPGAEAADPTAAGPFATLGDEPAQGVAYGAGAIYVATSHALWRIPYTNGDTTAEKPARIASYRQGPIAPNSDGDVHTSASVAVAGSHVYIGIGSSCNACRETDPTRATVQVANLDGSAMTTYATRARNAIALATNPATDTVWIGSAGQDTLPSGHPYEYFDALGAHSPVADYGWPDCEENQHPYTSGADCSRVVVPRVELPAYSTLIGAAFYPTNQSGAYAFPAAYRGGAFVSAHGSWHTIGGHHIPPHVLYVPMSGDTPSKPANFSDPTVQWSEFLSGFQNNSAGDARIGRPTGIAVGPQGSLFIADDQTGNIYRVRPAAPAPGSASRRR